MKFWAATVSAALMAVPTSAFIYPSAVQRHATQLFVDPSELTEYMAKAHEDKLKAVKQAEEKKNAEIENLKKELLALKSAPGALATTSSVPPPTGLDISQMTKEQLVVKLSSYQQFMAKYIVDAQQQKIQAVAAAENKIRQQYEEKLKLLSGSAEMAVPGATAASPAFQQRSAKVSAAAAAGKSRWGDMENEKAMAAGVVNGAVQVNGAAAPPSLAALRSSESTILFEKRNARVAAAGKAGKSRWGEPEVTKAAQAATSLPGSSAPPSVPAPAPVAAVPVPPEVVAADHGLRADGGVGGPSLAERINLGAQLVQAPVAASLPAPVGGATAPSSYFDKRNARVVAAGLAGKSRWGEMEIQKAQSVSASLPSSSASAPTIRVTPEIEAADHGLRADGGVGGPSLAQRINFGAQLVQAPVAAPLPAPVGGATAPSSYFDKRNARVAAAGLAGKSRWGEMEIQKAQSVAASLPSSSASAPTIRVTPEIEAADHGLRADGGVGGPSLAQRINFGAQLVQAPVAAPLPAPVGGATAPSSYFDKRNARVAAAGLAGKSRWGEMEIQKAQSVAASLPSSSASAPTIRVTPEIEAADHGLRADGGVGGPSLAQRVNLGAALLGQ